MMTLLAWAAVFMLPIAAAAVVLATATSWPWPWRVAVLSGGLLGTAAMGWVGGRRLLGSLRDGLGVLHALREGDYGIRASLCPGHDPLHPFLEDINALSDDMRRLRRTRTASSRFLGKALAALGDPVFVIDSDECILLTNAAARRLLGSEHLQLVGRDLASLGLQEPLAAADGTILGWHFAAVSGRWAVRRTSWHSHGQEHSLIMLHNLSAALGEEERNAWQRLIRVLNHELNNSLTPIGSLATSLHELLGEHDATLLKDELMMSLEVIARRSAGLARFLGGYGKLARLPPPRLRPVRLDLALHRLVRLESRLEIAIAGVDALTVLGDEDQLDQAFLNLLRNAVEAALPTGGRVRVDWRIEGSRAHVDIEDEGMGLPTSGALFVPLFTTKPEGSGIGLCLTRLIVNGHAGTVDLNDRTDVRGAIATVRLPIMR